MWMPDWSRRDRTHLYIMPRERYAEQEILTNAFAPSALIVDWREEFLKNVRPTQKLLSLTVSGEMNRLRTIGNSDKQIYSIINTEYLLAGLDEGKRQQFWLSLWSDFPHLTGILLFCVIDAPALLPDNLTLKDWEKDGRLFYADNL
jgi:hypothetical protein